jgi:hypothetical protein
MGIRLDLFICGGKDFEFSFNLGLIESEALAQYFWSYWVGKGLDEELETKVWHRDNNENHRRKIND